MGALPASRPSLRRWLSSSPHITFRRGEVLEAIAIKLEGLVDALGLVLNAAFRDWRDDPTFARAKLGSIDIASDQSIPALLDGEPFTLEDLAHVDIVVGAFKALRPARMDD